MKEHSEFIKKMNIRSKIITILVTLVFLTTGTGCQPYKKGNYTIKSGKETVQAVEISIYDEDNKVKYKGLDGESGEIEGSFEIYSN